MMTTYAAQRSQWASMARTSTQHVLNALALIFTNSGWQRHCRKNGMASLRAKLALIPVCATLILPALRLTLRSCALHRWRSKK
eukprot:414664-Amphidinium_carterae.1